jgi:hypothetical protein
LSWEQVKNKQLTVDKKAFQKQVITLKNKLEIRTRIDLIIDFNKKLVK